LDVGKLVDSAVAERRAMDGPTSLRFHVMRHAAASLLLANGMPITARLGYAPTSTILNAHAHVLPGNHADLPREYDFTYPLRNAEVSTLANPERLEWLKEGVDAWNERWRKILDGYGGDGVTPIPDMADLSGAHLRLERIGVACRRWRAR